MKAKTFFIGDKVYVLIKDKNSIELIGEDKSMKFDSYKVAQNWANKENMNAIRTISHRYGTSNYGLY